MSELIVVVGVPAVRGRDGLVASAGSAEEVQVATPEPSSGWAAQPVMPPPVKATVPVGFAVPETVAVKVTGPRTVEGFSEDWTFVFVAVASEGGRPTPKHPRSEHHEKRRHDGSPQAPAERTSAVPDPCAVPSPFTPTSAGCGPAQRSGRRQIVSDVRDGLVAWASQPALAPGRHILPTAPHVRQLRQRTSKFDGHGHLRD